MLVVVFAGNIGKDSISPSLETSLRKFLLMPQKAAISIPFNLAKKKPDKISVSNLAQPFLDVVCHMKHFNYKKNDFLGFRKEILL